MRALVPGAGQRVGPLESVFTVPATDGLHWDGVASRSPETSVAQRVREGGDPSYGTLTFGNLIML